MQDLDLEMMFQISARSPSGDCSAELEQFLFINPEFRVSSNERKEAELDFVAIAVGGRSR